MSARTKDSLYGLLIIFAVLISMSAFAQYGQDIDHHRIETTATITNTNTNTELKVEPKREVAVAKGNSESARLKKITKDLKSKVRD